MRDMCSVRNTKYIGTEHGMHGVMQFRYTRPRYEVLKQLPTQARGRMRGSLIIRHQAIR